MGIKTIDLELCNGCGICMEDCPMDVLYIDDRGKAFVKYARDCHECYLCEIYCPQKAIVVSTAATRKLHFGYDI